MLSPLGEPSFKKVNILSLGEPSFKKVNILSLGEPLVMRWAFCYWWILCHVVNILSCVEHSDMWWTCCYGVSFLLYGGFSRDWWVVRFLTIGEFPSNVWVLQYSVYFSPQWNEPRKMCLNTQNFGRMLSSSSNLTCKGLTIAGGGLVELRS